MHATPPPKSSFARVVVGVAVRAGAAMVAVAALGAMAGCNIIGPAMVIAQGPPKVQAVHTLEKEAPTVIFVDDRRSILPRRALRQVIAQQAERTLSSSGAVVTLIDSNAIQAAAARDTLEAPTDIATLGARVQARKVIWVTIDRFDISPDNVVFQPFADGRVKVIDAQGEARTWPEQPEGHPLRIMLPARREVPTSAADLAKAQEQLASEFGLALARLFFRYERETSLDQQLRNK